MFSSTPNGFLGCTGKLNHFTSTLFNLLNYSGELFTTWIRRGQRRELLEPWMLPSRRDSLPSLERRMPLGPVSNINIRTAAVSLFTIWLSCYVLFKINFRFIVKWLKMMWCCIFYKNKDFFYMTYFNELSQ